MKIYKYKIVGNPCILSLPADGKIVHFAKQGDDGIMQGLCIWVMFHTEPNEAMTFRERTFHVVGTGREFPNGAVHRGACFDGPFVWHLVEEMT